MSPPALIISSPSAGDEVKEKKQIRLIQFSNNTDCSMVMIPHERTRMTQQGNQANQDFIHISFANLNFCEEDEYSCTEYIKNILINGALVNGRKYIFCGHSNSQLKSRTCFLYAAEDHSVVERLINEQGNFSSITDVSKRAKRIGLLFSAAEHIVHLKESQTGEMDDIVRDGKIFTDGCGIMSAEFAEFVIAKYYEKICSKGVSRKYVPQVFQIRYKGYKGILVVDRDDSKFKGKGQLISSPVAPLDTSIDPNFDSGSTKPSIQFRREDAKVIFRKSMFKFDNSPSDELYLLELSKPGGGAKLNAEIVSLLSSLGVPDEVFLNKLYGYLNFIRDCSENVTTMLEFLDYRWRHSVVRDLAKLRVTEPKYVPNWIKTELRRAQKDELKESYDKNEIERVHIMIPRSRLLFGICDLSGKLLEGECVISYTTDKRTLARKTIIGKVMVARNPCLHPGDIQVFTAVDHIAELDHLVDCIIFPTVGKLPAAAQMSGGDLDGDKFFVTWDPDLIPPKTTAPFDYSTIEANPAIPFQHSNPQMDLINYFANYNNVSLGRISYLYSRWIRGKSQERAFCRECIALNTLYSKCVDGESVEIPLGLQAFPHCDTSKPFIVDTLITKIKSLLKCRFPRFYYQEFAECEEQKKEESLPGEDPKALTSWTPAPAPASGPNPPQIQQPLPIPVLTSSRLHGGRFGIPGPNIPHNFNQNQYGFPATIGQRRNWYQSNAGYSSGMNTSYEGYGYRNMPYYQQYYSEYRSENIEKENFSSSSIYGSGINYNWFPTNVNGQSSRATTFYYNSPEGSFNFGARDSSAGNPTWM